MVSALDRSSKAKGSTINEQKIEVMVIAKDDQPQEQT